MYFIHVKLNKDMLPKFLNIDGGLSMTACSGFEVDPC